MANHDERVEMLNVMRDGSLALLSTRPGAKVVAYCLAYGKGIRSNRAIHPVPLFLSSNYLSNHLSSHLYCLPI